jgi:hypothetical protein
MTPETKAAIKKHPVLRFFGWLWTWTLILTFFVGMPAVIISVVWMIVKAAFL